MEWVHEKTLRLFCPSLADIFIGGEAREGFQSSSKMVRHHEAVQMGFQVVMRSVVIPVDGRFLQGAVHAFDLSIGPGMLRLGHPVFNAVPVTAFAEHMTYILRRRTVAVPRRVAELATVIGQDNVDLVGDRRAQIV